MRDAAWCGVVRMCCYTSTVSCSTLIGLGRVGFGVLGDGKKVGCFSSPAVSYYDSRVFACGLYIIIVYSVGCFYSILNSASERLKRAQTGAGRLGSKMARDYQGSFRLWGLGRFAVLATFPLVIKWPGVGNGSRWAHGFIR